MPLLLGAARAVFLVFLAGDLCRIVASVGVSDTTHPRLRANRLACFDAFNGLWLKAQSPSFSVSLHLLLLHTHTHTPP